MSLTIASWNIRDGFSSLDTASLVVEHLQTADADIVVLQEAFTEESAEVATASAQSLLSETGYRHTISVPYNDADDRLDRHGLIAASRLPVLMRTVRLATRNAALIEADYTSINNRFRIVGAHFDDRQEATRRAQAAAAVQAVAFSDRSAIIGDLNSMHRDDCLAGLLRTIGPLANRLAASDPEPRQKMSMRRAASVAQRLVGMADGSTLRFLSESGYHDIDVAHQPTWCGVAQLDHILVNSGVRANDFARHKTTSLSDHRLISTRLESDV